MPSAADRALRDASEGTGRPAEAGATPACWRYLFEGAPTGIMLLGMDGRIVSANAACARQHGYRDPSEMVGTRWSELRDGDGTAGLESAVLAVPMGEPVVSELDHRRRDGARIRVRAEARRVELGGAMQFLVMLTDHTALSEAVQEVRRQDARLLLALEAAEMVTWELEIATGRLQYSTNLAEISGADDVSPYLTLEQFTEQVHPEDRAGTREAIQRTMATGCRFDCEYRVRLPDGSWHWLAGRGRAVAGPEGQWAHVLGVSLDITRRKESEAHFRSLVENSPDGLLVVDPVGGNFLSANPAAVRLYGAVGGSELMAATPWKLSPPTQPDGRASEAAAREYMGAAVRDGCRSFEWMHRRLDGGDFLAHVQLVKVQEHGRCVLQATVRDITSQRRAEEALRRSEAKYRVVADNTFDWEFWIDEEGRYVYSSPSCERITGYRPEEFEADPALLNRIVHPEDRDRYEAHQHQAAHGAGDVPQEFRIVRRDGGVRWIGHVCAPIIDPSGRLRGVRGSNRDITSRKAAEEALLRSHRQRERLLLFNEALLAAIPTPVFYKDREGRYLGCNRRFSELMGVSSSEIRGRTVDELWPSEQAREYHRRDLELLQEPGEQTYEFKVRDKDGVERDVLFVKSVFFDEDNVPAGIIGAFLDISERKRAEEALAEEALRRRILVEGSRDGIVVVDEDGAVFEANRRFADMLGYTPDEAKQLHVWDWDRNWSRERVLSAIRELGPEGAHFETQHTRKDGTAVDVELSNSVAQLGGRRLAFCICHDVTERKRAMEALARREEIFSTIVGQASDAVAVVDGASGRFVEFNAAAHENLGYTREEFAQFGVGDIQADHSSDQIRAVINDVQSLGSASFETRHRHKDGSVRDVRVSVRSLALRGSALMAAVWTDITDRKRAEARARRDNLRTEFLLELHRRAPQMQDRELWEHVLARAVELTDSEAGVLLSVADDQRSVRQTTWRRCPPGAGAALTSGLDLNLEAIGAWAECIRDHRAIVCPRATGCPADAGALEFGGERVSALMGIPIVEGGRVRWVLGVGGRAESYTEDDVAQLQLVANELHKISAQRAAQNQLRQLSRAVEQSPVSVVITNTQGTIEYTNPRFSQVTGYTAQEVLGQNPRVLKSGEQSEAYYRELWLTVMSGRAWHGEFHNRKKNGEMYWESASISPIVDPAGKLTHFVAVKEDITERKRLESQLRQAQKLEAVGQLAGGVAHDFNNILAAIMMHLGLAQMNPALDDETRETLKEIEVESARAASLTRQLLMFSRRSVLAMKPHDLNDVVANLLKMLTRLISENIRLRFEGASHLPFVEADAGMLEQVILNLVVNARDAMPRGGCITLGTAAVEAGPETKNAPADRAGGPFVRLTVSDTGIGMDDATLRRIFEPFFTTKEAGRGTGLGLATVHGIVAQHRGWVEVESGPGRGSTFRVYLPAMAREHELVAEKAAETPLPGGRETVLVVEDEARLRQLMARTLRGLGYCVHEAENGQDAMRLWREAGTRVDLLLTDMVMPEGVTGLELAERLLAAKPGLRVIITSGYSAEIVEAGLPAKSGITYLPKPFLDRTLADVVRASLDRKG